LKIYLEEQGKKSFYAKDVRSAFRIRPTTMKRYLYQLTSCNYLKITGGDRYRKGYEYKVVDPEEYENLRSNVQTALDKALEAVKAQQRADQQA